MTDEGISTDITLKEPEGFHCSILFKQNYQSAAHIVINQGGTSSGKTFAIEQALFCIAGENPKQVITIVGQDIPNLKAGAMRDALNIFNSSPVLQAKIKSYNKSDRIFEFLNGSKAVDIELWKVYARGLTGKITGLIFDNWYICEAIPADARLIALGLDFGFTNDETGCLELYQQNGELWANELFYETGLTNTDISAKLKEAGVNLNNEIIADSAEPKSIEELKRQGWRITPAKKGADSVKNSIDILKRYKVNVTRNSVNLRNELNRYKWRADATGKTINEPVDSWNHLIDPLRYIALNKLKIHSAGKLQSRLPHQPGNQQTSVLHGLI